MSGAAAESFQQNGRVLGGPNDFVDSPRAICRMRRSSAPVYGAERARGEDRYAGARPCGDRAGRRQAHGRAIGSIMPSV